MFDPEKERFPGPQELATQDTVQSIVDLTATKMKRDGLLLPSGTNSGIFFGEHSGKLTEFNVRQTPIELSDGYDTTSISLREADPHEAATGTINSFAPDYKPPGPWHVTYRFYPSKKGFEIFKHGDLATLTKERQEEIAKNGHTGDSAIDAWLTGNRRAIEEERSLGLGEVQEKEAKQLLNALITSRPKEILQSGFYIFGIRIPGF